MMRTRHVPPPQSRQKTRRSCGSSGASAAAEAAKALGSADASLVCAVVSRLAQQGAEITRRNERGSSQARPAGRILCRNLCQIILGACYSGLIGCLRSHTHALHYSFVRCSKR